MSLIKISIKEENVGSQDCSFTVEFKDSAVEKKIFYIESPEWNFLIWLLEKNHVYVPSLGHSSVIIFSTHEDFNKFKFLFDNCEEE